MQFDQAWTQMNDTHHFQTKEFILDGGQFGKPGNVRLRIMI